VTQTDSGKAPFHKCTKDDPHYPEKHGPYAVHVDMIRVGRYGEHGLCPNCGGRFPSEFGDGRTQM
jgi:hypothetical protein